AHRTNDCVACHMPARQPTDISHTVTTDHWIRRRPAGGQEGANASQLAFLPLEDFFHAAGIGEQGVAHISLGIRSNRPANLAHGMELLRKAFEQEPDNPRWQYWFGYALRKQEKNSEAIDRLIKA